MTKSLDVRRDVTGTVAGRRIAILIFLFLLSFHLLFASLRIGSGDGETIYRVARSLVEERGFAIPPPNAELYFVQPRHFNSFMTMFGP